MKVYVVSLRDAFRMFGFLLVVGSIIYLVVFLPLSSILHFSGIQIVPEKSCEEKYSSFPEKYLPDKTREKYLEICNIGLIVHESTSTPDVDAGIKNFEIIDTFDSGNPEWFGEKIHENYFKVYRNKLTSLMGSRALNLRSSVAFDEKSENVSMDLNCVTQEGVFVSSMIDDNQRYRLESIPQLDLDFKLGSGYGYLQCDQTCTKNKVTFRFKYYGGVDFYHNNTKLAEMNTGELMGTRLIYVEANKPTMIALGFTLDGEDSATIECNVRVVSQSPLKTFEKSFIIEYIAKDTECKDYTELGNYESGQIIVDFIQDVSKEQVESLLSSYGLSSDQIEFPERFDFRIDFEGNEKGFVGFLEEHEFIETGNPNVFIARSFKDIKCDDAKEIFRSYPDISINNIYCFKSVKGIVEVPEGEEDKWLCELKQNDIVMDANLNILGSIAD